LTLLHELTHLDLAANSPTPNPRITDHIIGVKDEKSGKTNDVGYYIQRNADNYVWYAFAKYLMTKNGNVYPHLPIVTYTTERPPRDAYAQPSVAEFTGSEGSVALYANDSVNVMASDEGLEGCVVASAAGGITGPISIDPTVDINIDRMVDDSAYPADYRNSVAGWMADLGVDKTATGSSSTTAGAASTATSSSSTSIMPTMTATSNTTGAGSLSTTNTHPEEQQCHGVSGDVWVDHADKATAAIKEFCAQKNNPVDYYPNSEDNMRLHLNNEIDPSKGIADHPDCVGVFQNQLVDGCDGNDTSNNPHNYKFGGTYYAGDGWRFEFDALATQVNTVDCDVSYRVVLDRFELRGKNLPDAKFGKDGEGLHEEVGGCGAITKWHFEWTPDDSVFEWYASGQLPIGTKACVGRALVSAGGSSGGGC
ncbi:MAG: hypothetical protein Q9224_006126, partial [Gallowayella concinna]